MNIQEQFTKEKLTLHMARYEMYYQVALGNLISQTNVEPMSYDIDFQQALGALYELFADLNEFEYANEVLDKEIQKQAAIDAVQNFVNEHLEMVKNNEFELEPIINAINDEVFFNPAMLLVCEEQIENQLLAWQDVITEELSAQIIASIEALEN